MYAYYRHTAKRAVRSRGQLADPRQCSSDMRIATGHGAEKEVPSASFPNGAVGIFSCPGMLQYRKAGTE